MSEAQEPPASPPGEKKKRKNRAYYHRQRKGDKWAQGPIQNEDQSASQEAEQAQHSPQKTEEASKDPMCSVEKPVGEPQGTEKRSTTPETPPWPAQYPQVHDPHTQPRCPSMPSSSNQVNLTPAFRTNPAQQNIIHPNIPSPNDRDERHHHHILDSLAQQNYFIPKNATLDSPALILFKRDTPTLDIFWALINQLYAELTRMSEGVLRPPSPGDLPAIEGYALKEEIMFKMLVEIVPVLSHLSESVAVEVGKGVSAHSGGVRLFVGGARDGPA